MKANHKSKQPQGVENLAGMKRNVYINHFAEFGKFPDKEMREFYSLMTDDMNNMYIAGKAIKAEGIEQPNITMFMEVFGLPGEMADEMPFEAYMQVIHALYGAFEDGYKGIKR